MGGIKRKDKEHTLSWVCSNPKCRAEGAWIDRKTDRCRHCGAPVMATSRVSASTYELAFRLFIAEERLRNLLQELEEYDVPCWAEPGFCSDENPEEFLWSCTDETCLASDDEPPEVFKHKCKKASSL